METKEEEKQPQPRGNAEFRNNKTGSPERWILPWTNNSCTARDVLPEKEEEG